MNGRNCAATFPKLQSCCGPKGSPGLLTFKLQVVGAVVIPFSCQEPKVLSPGPSATFHVPLWAKGHWLSPHGAREGGEIDVFGPQMDKLGLEG
jgi:hypothetical protein